MRLRRASQYFVLFMAVSFLGWAAETLFFLFCYGRFCDRGFMTMPFCTIYGCSFLLLYFLIGIPGDEGSGLLLSGNCGRGRSFFVYFLLSALIPTCLELITGYFFHQVFGIRLWSYFAYRFHFQGYICLEYTLLWGVLIPFSMKWIFAPLKKWVFAIPEPYMQRLAAILALMAIVDWTANFSRQELMIFINAA